MPRAHAGVVKYHYRGHDNDTVFKAPPVQNEWYELFDDEDVRLTFCNVIQENDETAAKDVQFRWTIDGIVYLETVSLDNGVFAYIWRSPIDLDSGTEVRNAGFYTDARGQDFKVEVKMTSAPGTNQTLTCRTVRETLELT